MSRDPAAGPGGPYRKPAPRRHWLTTTRREYSAEGAAASLPHSLTPEAWRSAVPFTAPPFSPHALWDLWPARGGQPHLLASGHLEAAEGVGEAPHRLRSMWGLGCYLGDIEATSTRQFWLAFTVRPRAGSDTHPETRPYSLRGPSLAGAVTQGSAGMVLFLLVA